MPPADPTPPLMAERLAALRADAGHTLARAVPQPEACRWASISLELLDAHAALTAQVARRTAERDALKRAVVEMAIPYEALRMDDDSRKWIAPSVWKMIIAATEQGRAILAAPTEG